LFETATLIMLSTYLYAPIVVKK